MQLYQLTKRQRQILVLLSRGLNNADIAAELEISEHTVKVHMWRLFKKMKVNSRIQALILFNNLESQNDSFLENFVLQLYEFLVELENLDQAKIQKRSYLIGGCVQILREKSRGF